MRHTRHWNAIAGILVTTGLVSLASPADAFTINQNDQFDQLLAVLLGDTTGLDNFSGTVSGNPIAFGLFTDDPFGLSSGVVLSTGNVEEIPGFNTQDNFFGDGADLSTPDTVTQNEDGSPFDVATLEINFEAADTVESLFFEYVFGSEEFLEFAGSEFNDFFSLELNGSNLALLTDSEGENNIVEINNLAQSPTGPFSDDYIDNPAGSTVPTKLDGYTRPLTFEGQVVPGTNTLRIQIADVSDDILDSAVFIKAGTLSTGNPDGGDNPGDDPDVVGIPEPSMLVGLLLLGGVSLGARRRVQSP